MRPVASFSLQPAGADRCQLTLDGTPTRVVTFGKIVEAAFHCPNDAYLLILSCDVPYEEELDILLLSHDLRILDRRKLGKPYTPGIFRLQAASGDRIAFQFHGEQRHTLRVASEPEGLLRRYLFLTSEPIA